MIPEERYIPYRASDPTGMRSLVLAPHPDDETFGCGGTLALHARAGDQVKVVFLTSGDRGDISGGYEPRQYAQTRESEAQKACNCLGVHDVEFWGYPDRGLDKTPAVVKSIHTLLKDFKPQKIYITSPLEIHPDHIAAASHFFEAIQDVGPDFKVAFYEVNQPLRVNCLVDISPVVEVKKKAFQAYVSQLDLLPYTEISLALNHFRSVTLPGNVTHAEAFSIWSSRDLRKCRLRDFAAKLFSEPKKDQKKKN